MTPRLTTTTEERADALAHRRVRMHVDGESALVYGKTKDENGEPQKYRTTLQDCTCGIYKNRIAKAKEINDPNFQYVAGVTPIEFYACKHMIRVRKENLEMLGLA